MTTHAWAEQASGTWTLEIRFDYDNQTDATIRPTYGELFEWSLVLHGTKIAPYVDQIPLIEHGDRSKLSIVKQIHVNRFQDKGKFVKLLHQDHQQRLGSDDNELSM